MVSNLYSTQGSAFVNKYDNVYTLSSFDCLNFLWQWDYTYKAGWSNCPSLLKIRNFCGVWSLPLSFLNSSRKAGCISSFMNFAGLLFSNVPGIGSYWFLAWACLFAGKFVGVPSRHCFHFDPLIRWLCWRHFAPLKHLLCWLELLQVTSQHIFRW